MHVIEDSRRFARSKGNTLRGVTLKVSTEMLTPISLLPIVAIFYTASTLRVVRVVWFHRRYHGFSDAVSHDASPEDIPTFYGISIDISRKTEKRDV